MLFVVFASGVHSDMALLNAWFQTAHCLVSHVGLIKQATDSSTGPANSPQASLPLLLGLMSLTGSTKQLGIVCSSAGDGRVLGMVSGLAS